MKTITIDISDEEFKMIQKVCHKRKKSIRSLVLRFFFELSHEDERKEVKKT